MNWLTAWEMEREEREEANEQQRAKSIKLNDMVDPEIGVDLDAMR